LNGVFLRLLCGESHSIVFVDSWKKNIAAGQLVFRGLIDLKFLHDQH
jgi:hypothetical protein